MKVVSSPARKLLKQLMKVRTDMDYIIYEQHRKLLDNNQLALDELTKLSFLKKDYAGNYRITTSGMIYLLQYKTYTRDTCLTSFWLPLAVSIFGTVATLIIQYLLVYK